MKTKVWRRKRKAYMAANGILHQKNSPVGKLKSKYLIDEEPTVQE